uniref:Phospholipid phosphatase 6-like n=1 Tax=Ciona intestinalis TaxID=7719 RepID=H2Y104_CIOIN|nr:phospholipid phosphatase 6-like [Ciona intestinalis]|eukprot:XP_002130324.1 phospholipid phosphatase 6-like [Ciona intestinalis]
MKRNKQASVQPPDIHICQSNDSKFIHVIKDVDYQFSKKIAVCSAGGHLRPVLMLLELSGHGIPWFLGTILTIFNSIDGVKETCMNLLLALIFDLFVVALIKGLFRRPRPTYNKQDMLATVSLDVYSFPSGHSTRSVMVAFFLINQFNLSLFCKVLLIIWSFCVCTSRVMLGRHHISDVICGFFIGYSQYYIVVQFWWSYFDFSEMLHFIW